MSDSLEEWKGAKRSGGWVAVSFMTFATVVVIADALGLSCQKSSPAPAASVSASVAEPVHLERVRIATSKNLWCALTLIASKRNFYREQGIDSEISYQAAGRLNMDALIGSAADVANVVETNIAYQALSQASDLAIHGTVVTAKDYTILTKRGAGIEHSENLRGKRIDYAQATGAESFLYWYLEHEKVPVSTVKLVALQPAGLVDHFMGSQSEAVATWEPFASAIQQKVKDVDVLYQGQAGEFVGIMTVATRRSWSDAHPATVKAYVAAMTQASLFIVEHPQDAQRIVSTETGIPLATVESIWKRFNFSYRASNSEDVKLVSDVIRRIIENVPSHKGHDAPDPGLYFPGVAH